MAVSTDGLTVNSDLWQTTLHPHVTRNEQPIAVQMNQSTKIRPTDRISSARGTASKVSITGLEVPNAQEEERRRCLHVPRDPHPALPRCPGRPHSSDCITSLNKYSRPRGSDPPEPPSISAMTATLCCSLSHWHRTWLSRERVASSPERALANLLNGVDDKT